MTKARNLAKLISDNTVGTAEIDDGAVTTAKLADDAVTPAKLNVNGADIPYDNSVSGISATTLQAAIDYLNVLSGGGSAGAQATYTREEFTATAGQTTFTTANGYTLGYLQVFMNGIMLDSGDYTANDESTVVLATGAAANDEVTTIAYDSFAISEVLRVMNISASASNNALTLGADNTLSITGKIDAKSAPWVNFSGQVQFGETGFVANYSGGSNVQTLVGNNAYYNGGYRSIKAGAKAVFMNAASGEFTFNNAPATAAAGDALAMAELMKIDSAGRVTTPYQPSFQAWSNTGGNEHFAGGTNPSFLTISSNVGNHFNGTTFTAPVSGRYLFFYTILSGTSGDYGLIALNVNGGPAVGSQNWTQHFTTATNDQQNSSQQILTLSANDQVNLYIHPAYNHFYWNGAYSKFGGYLIG